MKCEECKKTGVYPYYGVAPHVHNLNKTGSFIGSTILLDKEKYPDNYDDIDNGCGIYYCPNEKCENSKQKQIGEEE